MAVKDGNGRMPSPLRCAWGMYIIMPYLPGDVNLKIAFFKPFGHLT